MATDGVETVGDPPSPALVGRVADAGFDTATLPGATVLGEH